MTITFDKNGTCQTLLTYVNPDGKLKSYTFREYWKIKNNIIHYTVYESSDESLLGGETAVKIVRFDDNNITIQSSSDGHISELNRIK